MSLVGIVRDFGLKLVAITCAATLWLGVAGDPEAEQGLRVPLLFENLPSSLEVLGDPPETVEVRLSGPPTILRSLDANDIEVFIDLASERPGARLFDMTVGRVRTPLGVEVVRVVPSTIAVTLEVSGESRVVPIVPVIIGEPSTGFVIGRVEVDPAMVTVVGPLSRLRELPNVTTESLDVTQMSSPLESIVTVGVVDPRLRLMAPLQARVRVEFIRSHAEKILTDVPVLAVNTGVGFSISMMPLSVAVTVKGLSGQIVGFDEDSVEASVDLSGLGVGRYNLPVNVKANRPSQVVAIEPRVIEVVLN